MSKKLTHDEDLFLNFLIKEKEIIYLKKIHAQTTIKLMEKVTNDEIRKETFLQKGFCYIKDSFEFLYLKLIGYKNKQQIKYLTDNDKLDKFLIHKQYKHGNFKTHFFLIRRFQSKTIINNIGFVDMSNFKYDVFLRLEFNGIISQQCLKKVFNNENDARNYFNQLLSNKKNQNIIALIKELSNRSDKEYEHLKKECDFFRKKLLSE